MWRTWVDRINAASKESASTDPEVPKDPHAPSPETLKRQQEQQNELNALLRKTEDQSLTEKERNDLFLGEFLPKFSKLWEEDLKNGVFLAIDDTRSFMARLTRVLLGGIRQVPEQNTKAGSSQALMDNLRSRSHLYNVITAVKVVAHGPDTFISLMLQQRIPSIIIKLFRSFIDLPVDYYNDTNEKSQGEGEQEEEEEEEDMVSFENVANVITDTLKQFAQSPAILHRLISEDTFFMMVQLLSAKPAEWTDEEEEEEPAFFRWKYRALDILKCVPMTMEVSQYLRSRRSIGTLIQKWSEIINKQRITPLDFREILLGLQLTKYQLQASIDADYFGLYDDFNQGHAWDILATLLIVGNSNDNVAKLKDDIVNVIGQMIFIGKNVDSPILSESSPFQHEDFKYPKATGPKDQIVHNALAYSCLLTAFAYPNPSLQLQIHPRHKRPIPVPEQLRRDIFNTLKRALLLHPVNYFILERLNSVPLLIESMENESEDIQNGVLDMLVYILRNLNFVPLKEMAVISLHFQSSASGKLIKLICNRFTLLLREYPKFQTVLRESGFSVVISRMISVLTEAVQKDQVKGDTFEGRAIRDFDSIADCLTEMLEDPSNAHIFKKTYRGNLFELLRRPTMRAGVLKIFETLSCQENAVTPPSTSPRRSSSSSGGTTAGVLSDTETSFSRLMEAIQTIPREDLDLKINILKSMQRIFVAHGSTRDVFRSVGGFVTLVSMIVALEKDAEHDDQESSSNVDQDKRAKMLSAIFAVLAESMRDHNVNKRFFREHVGYAALENALSLTEALSESGIPRQVFGILIAFAVEDETVSDIFVLDDENSSSEYDAAARHKAIEKRLKSVSVSVANPDVLPSILHLLQTIKYDDDLCNEVLIAIYALARGSRRNQVKMNRSGLILTALEQAYPEDEANETQPRQKELLVNIVKKLLTMGVSYEEMLHIFRSFNIRDHTTALEPKMVSLMDLVIEGASRSRWPNFIQFDVGAAGYSCLEIPNVENFPPQSSGYTLMIWFHIERLDDTMPLTLFTVFDGKRVVSTVYIDAITRKLQIQQTGYKQKVDFNSFQFQAGYWYHLALVHQRSRLGNTLSSMNLYINGVCMESVRCPFLPQLAGDVKCVIGTPRDMAAATTSPSLLIWDLGPTYLIRDLIDDDLLSLYFNLGARYKSLFQDNLRQFQTYEASSALFLSLRHMNKAFGRKEASQSALANAMRGSGNLTILPESKFAFAFFASNALSRRSQTGLTLTGLSEEALQLVASCTEELVLNSAIAKLENALAAPKLMGYLIGNPVIAHPFGVDESIWRIGGCAVALTLIERSESPEMLRKAVAILCETVRYSWRNSEDMERHHGYEILAYLLKKRRELLTVDVVEQLLVFIGKDPAYPEESMINNPFAYRYVFLNFEIWKKTSLDVQKVHLQQFKLFLEQSKRRAFNVRRVQKFQIVKKMLLAFRMHIYAKDLLPHLIEALKIVMLCSWSTDSIRAVATFLASTVSKETDLPTDSTYPPTTRPSRSGSIPASLTTGQPEFLGSKTGFIADVKSCNGVNKAARMRNVVLEMLHDILSDSAHKELTDKFAATITNRWPLLFFEPDLHPYTVVLSCRILMHVLISQGPGYVGKFRVASEGFLVLSKLLPHYWYLTQLQCTLMGAIMGIEVPITCTTEQLKELLSNAPSKFFIPDLVPVVVAMWREATKFTTERKTNTLIDTPAMATEDVTRTQAAYIRLFDELYAFRPDFRDVCCRAETVDAMVEVLFPAVLPTGPVDAATELAQCESDMESISLIDTQSEEQTSIQADSPAASIIKRGGTSTLMTKTSPHTNRKMGAMVTKLRSASWSSSVSTDVMKMINDEALEALLELLVDISVQSIVDPTNKNLSGLVLVLQSFPPSDRESKLKFESLLMTHIAQTLKCTLQVQENLLADNKVLTNVAKFCQMAADAVLQGRFMNGAEQTYDLLASIMENLQSPDFYARYGPSSPQTVATFYKSFNRMILLKISDLEQEDMPSEQISAFLNYCIHHQKIILSSRNTDLNFLRCFCYHLYLFLLFDDENIKNDAANVWKLLLLQKPDAVASIFKVRVKGIELDDLAEGFRQMLEMDIASFFVWIESRKVDLNLLFKEHISKTWENIILSENKYSQEMLKEHQARRAAKLKKLQRKQTYEDELLQDYTTKTAAWTQSIQNVEISRFTKALQDNDGHDNFISSEWARISGDLLRERGLWGPRNNSSQAKWRLDYTEGPQRMRKKIQQFSEGQKQLYQPKHSSAISYTPKSKKAAQPITVDTEKGPEQEAKPLIDIEKDLTSSPATTGKPQELPLEASDHEPETEHGEAEQQMEEEDSIAYEEDKNRKVLRLLDPDDMVLDVYNVSQIAGLDAREGLLLLCKQNIYLIDNFFQRSDGEVVEIWDVPKEERDQYLILLAQAAGMDTDTTVDASGDLHVCRKWANIDIREVYKRRFLFRDVAIEIFFADGRNALITVDKQERDELYTKLANRVTMYQSSSESILGAPAERDTSAFGGSFKLSNLFGSSTLHDLTQKWEKREITNFQYLMYLNAIAGRSYNDLTQYPVFPWILADYTSEELDLENPKTFRDLSKPMGAQTPERRDEFADRYRQWGETNDPAPAFHYGTHYSSAMIVCSFLIRLEPFTQHYLKLQGGTFDHADRLFDSVGKAWESASEKNMGDVRELIPEFFYLPEFLENVNKFDFGEKQGTGETIDSVILPPWAHGDPHIFIQKHREALESDYVSQNLHHWIDLIFGYKQQGQAAIDNMNVFHHVSYEGAVDLDAITDVVEKTATIGIINNFGQTPRQLFKKPHPKRLPANPDTAHRGFIPYQDHIDKLCQSILPIRNIQRQIGDIGVHNDKLGVTACQQLFMPSDGSKFIEWGFSDNSLRLFSTETGKLLRIFENMHMGFISTACFPDVRMLATGGTDNVVCMWKVKQEKAIDFLLLECLRGHSAPVTCLTSSRSYSVLVSGSKDKTAIIWDLNRLEYVRTLSGHEGPVDIVSVNEATGDIITCSGHMIRVWSINGNLYLTRSACSSSENILSCIYYEGKINEYCNYDLLITGHRKGVIKFWSKELVKDSATGRKKWGLVLRRQIQQEGSDIVALSFAGLGKRTLLSGNADGQVYAYVLPDTTDTLHYVKDDRYKECMECGKAFSVLDRKTHCRTCGGLFCSGCLSPAPFPLPDRSARFCRPCYTFLSSRAI